MHPFVRSSVALAAAGLLWLGSLGAGQAVADDLRDPRDPLDVSSWSRLRHEPSVQALTPEILGPALLSLDDGSREVDLGFSAGTAVQFLWFNRFDAPAPGADFALEEIQVLFPPGPDVVPGAAIELVVFTDPDGDPTNGADLALAFDDVIQVVDGVSFSVYPIDPPLVLPAGSGDVLLGVINRYVTSGVSPPSRPAALDASASAGRSWFALWTGDPPNPPSLPPDDVLATIDLVEPGNWMIRGAGSALSAVEVPAVDGLGLALLALLLAVFGAWLLRR